jgi:hypothetical protein
VVRFAFAIALLLLTAPVPVTAQRNGVQLDVSVPAANQGVEGPMVATQNLLSSPNTREILQAGFATQISYRVELWRKGALFYELSDRVEWLVRIQFDPADQLYHVIRRQNKQLEDFGGFTTLTGAEAQFGKAFRAPIHPGRTGRFYYNLVVEVQPLLESDLDALQQWLKGSSSPAKSGAVVAIRGGVGRLMSRILGGDKQIYAKQSGVFEVR